MIKNVENAGNDPLKSLSFLATDFLLFTVVHGVAKHFKIVLQR